MVINILRNSTGKKVDFISCLPRECDSYIVEADGCVLKSDEYITVGNMLYNDRQFCEYIVNNVNIIDNTCYLDTFLTIKFIYLSCCSIEEQFVRLLKFELISYSGNIFNGFCPFFFIDEYGEYHRIIDYIDDMAICFIKTLCCTYKVTILDVERCQILQAKYKMIYRR